MKKTHHHTDGDSIASFEIHGKNAMGWMTLTGHHQGQSHFCVVMPNGVIVWATPPNEPLARLVHAIVTPQ